MDLTATTWKGCDAITAQQWDTVILVVYKLIKGGQNVYTLYYVVEPMCYDMVGMRWNSIDIFSRAKGQGYK